MYEYSVRVYRSAESFLPSGASDVVFPPTHLQGCSVFQSVACNGPYMAGVDVLSSLLSPLHGNSHNPLQTAGPVRFIPGTLQSTTPR